MGSLILMARLSRFRAVPWLLLVELGWTINRHYQQLPQRDRSELTRLLTKSKGLPQNLSAKEREDLKRIVTSFDYKAVGRDLIPVGRKAVTRRRR
jgi:hypothetical protein